ncbi:hypothetical protein TNCV_1794381 [Trichonephila clavipes]|nr:hypothetical protein TNCV_1794381 [Trichonephila clavipes]
MANSFLPQFPQDQTKKGNPSENRKTPVKEAIKPKTPLKTFQCVKVNTRCHHDQTLPPRQVVEPETSKPPRENPATTDGNNTHNHEGETLASWMQLLNSKILH